MKHLPLILWVAFLTVVHQTNLLAAEGISVTVTNPGGLARSAETIEIPWTEITGLIPGAMPDHLTAKDAAGNILPTQYTNFHPENKQGLYDTFLFQHDFQKGEKNAVFTLRMTPDPVPPFPSKVFARYVPERFDDFAWENDRIAHRIYGQGLETPAAGKSMMIGSGIDIWSKRVRYPIVDRWYLKSHDNYHKDTGEGLDMYETGKWRGCGGTGIWDGKTLLVSHNWKSWRVLANGPIRSVFELTYDPWDGGGFQISETKRFTVDAGHNLDKIESTFFFGGKQRVIVGIGLGKHPKAATELTEEKDQGWMTLWEKYEDDGQLGTAILLPPGESGTFDQDKNEHLILVAAESGRPLLYYAGAGWDRSGDFSSKEDWNSYVGSMAARLKEPVSVTCSPLAQETVPSVAPSGHLPEN